MTLSSRVKNRCSRLLFGTDLILSFLPTAFLHFTRVLHQLRLLTSRTPWQNVQSALSASFCQRATFFLSCCMRYWPQGLDVSVACPWFCCFHLPCKLLYAFKPASASIDHFNQIAGLLAVWTHCHSVILKCAFCIRSIANQHNKTCPAYYLPHSSVMQCHHHHHLVSYCLYKYLFIISAAIITVILEHRVGTMIDADCSCVVLVHMCVACRL